MSDDIKEPTQTQPTPPPAVPEMISVPKDFVEKATKLIESIPKLNEQIERLTAAADKSQLANYDLRHAKEIVRKVLVNFIDNKLVMSWRTTKDVVVRDSQGRWYEDQKIEVLFEDLSKREMAYNPDFVHGRKQVMVDVISMFTTPEQQQMVRVNIDGRQVDFDIRFIN
jgi:hypothetical protein